MVQCGRSLYSYGVLLACTGARGRGGGGGGGGVPERVCSYRAVSLLTFRGETREITGNAGRGGSYRCRVASWTAGWRLHRVRQAAGHHEAIVAAGCFLHKPCSPHQLGANITTKLHIKSDLKSQAFSSAGSQVAEIYRSWA